MIRITGSEIRIGDSVVIGGFGIEPSEVLAIEEFGTIRVLTLADENFDLSVGRDEFVSIIRKDDAK